MGIDRRIRARIIIAPDKKFTEEEFSQIVDEFISLRERIQIERLRAALNLNSQCVTMRCAPHSLDETSG